MGSLLALLPPAASSFANEVDALYLFLILTCGGVTLLVFVLVTFFAIRYRRRASREIVRREVLHGSLPLEITWSVIPFCLMLVMFGWGTKLYFEEYTAPPSNTIDIYVTGKQWMWKVQHPDGQLELNELHVPAGRPVKLTLASEDVIHSFFIPAFRIKRDVVPGRYQTMWFNATKPGRYHLFCAEYCGTQHSQMIGWVTVLDPAGYESWLAGESTGGGSMAQRGQKLFAQYGCISCHVMDQAGRCPNLRNVYGYTVQLEGGGKVTADEAYLRESILDPNAKIVSGYKRDVMPVFRGQLNEEELLHLVVYLKTLSDREGKPTGGARK